MYALITIVAVIGILLLRAYYIYYVRPEEKENKKWRDELGDDVRDNF